MSQGHRLWGAIGVLILGVRVAAWGAAAEPPPDHDQPAPLPDRYVVDYPVAARFCSPISGFFEEASRSFSVVRGRTFTHKPNGGYGLPIVYTVQGKHLVHVGADVGWHREGMPVYAVAAGVVRCSQGPVPPQKATGIASQKSNATRPTSGRPAFPARTTAGHGITSLITNKGPERFQGAVSGFGNLVAVEHRLPDGQYLTTIYGHLGAKRLVKAGDIVEAGQPIGTIGGKHVLINGGYDPHLHFGIRDGRVAEPGCTLFVMKSEEEPEAIKLVALGESEIEIDPGPTLTKKMGSQGTLTIGTSRGDFTTMRRGDRFFLPAAILWTLAGRPGCEVSGDVLSTEGWHDPVAFLRQAGAVADPSLFRKPGNPTPRSP